ncbi:hypothetical protein L5515_002201 [Caenorhabditis briggsae]|uniref:Uncharacterized protein n=1 Tax=Caenorhabditis briggsae TaxID=6238 RepID=A0AAE9E5U1_CAEBR|nr:hypothetical protein L5515_002201 [Caenorhabditis briggsae]
MSKEPAAEEDAKLCTSKKDTDIQSETSNDDNFAYCDVYHDSGENEIDRIYDAPLISEEGSSVLESAEDQLDMT